MERCKMTEMITKEISKRPWESKRLIAYALALSVLTTIGCLGLLTGAEPGALVATTGPILTLAMGYVGAQSWHDKAVRIAMIEQAGVPSGVAGPST